MVSFRNHGLLYNGVAHFEAVERFGGNGILQAVSQNMSDLCWMLAKMSEQHEAYNRYYGIEADKPLDAEELMVTMLPSEVPEARTAVLSAIMHGMSTEENKRQEIDVVLEELQKKTEKR